MIGTLERPSRRAVIGGAVGVAVLAPVAVTTLPPADPIADAWQSYKLAWFQFADAVDASAKAGRRHGPLYSTTWPMIERMDCATDAMLAGRAQTPATAAMKLRRALGGLVNSEVTDRMTLGTATAADLRTFEAADDCHRLLWSAIEDLERMANR